MPAAHVIHTVGPIYDVDSNPEASLKSAYAYGVVIYVAAIFVRSLIYHPNSKELVSHCK